MRKYLTIADVVLIGASLCLIVGSYVFAHSTLTEGSVALIQVDDRIVHKISLHEASTATIHGVRGFLTVETREGRVAITSADCPNHICIKTGWRSRSGEVIVCVPNKTVIRITGSQNEVRATTG